MIARYHFDDDVYRKLLDDTLETKNGDSIRQHMESCESCQRKLESLSESEISWDEVRRFLNDSETEDLIEQSADPIDAPSLADQTLSFLDPSETEGSIGAFGRYEIREILGRGGMGIVMRGYDPALNRDSAIKVLAPELATHAAAKRRFSREAKSAAAVVHEHVVPIQTVDQQNGVPYFVMPVVEGKTLQTRISESGPLEVVEILRIGMQIASGLSAAHAQGLVHRDVKPANVLLENGVERVRITDFGLARAADDASMTRSGVIAGTPQYMSPEQARGADIQCSSDLFSLGSVLYCMCTGHSPFRADTTVGVLHRIVNDDPRSIRSINADIPPWLEQIILRLLAKDPDDRFSSASEVADELSAWLAHVQHPEQSPAPRTMRRSKRSIRWSRFLTIAACCAAFVLSFMIYLNTGTGTITIQAGDSSVPIRILKNDEVVETMLVRDGLGKTEIAAGKYTIEIEGDGNDYSIEGDKITVYRGSNAIATITAKQPSSQSESLSVPLLDKIPQSSRLFHSKQHSPLTTADELTRLFGAIPKSPSHNAQVFFTGSDPIQYRIRFESARAVPGSPDALELETPARVNLRCGNVQELTIRDISTAPRLTIESQLEICPAAANAAFLQHNSIPIRLSQDDFDQIASNNAVTKVIYLPDGSPALAGTSELVSSRLDPGIDPIEEASRRGEPLAILRLRSIDLSENGFVSMATEIKRFNEVMESNKPNHGQPVLTEEELDSFARGQLARKELDGDSRELFESITQRQQLPQQWQFGGGPTLMENEAYGKGVRLSGWAIVLFHRDKPQKFHQIRKRFLGYSPKLPVGPPVSDPDAIPLSAAIQAFNASHHSVRGIRQPALTEDEVIAAILDWKARRDEAPVINRDFDAFQKITETRSLPKDYRFEVIPEFQTAEATTFYRWSIRLVIPKSDKEGWTHAFGIREHWIAAESITADELENQKIHVTDSISP